MMNEEADLEGVTEDISGVEPVSDEDLEKSDYTITVPTDGTGIFDVRKIDFCYKSGYTETMRTINEIKKNCL